MFKVGDTLHYKFTKQSKLTESLSAGPTISGERIRTFFNHGGIAVSPNINFFGVPLSATKPLPTEFIRLLTQKGATIEQITEEGARYISVSGIFKITEHELAPFHTLESTGESTTGSTERKSIRDTPSSLLASLSSPSLPSPGPASAPSLTSSTAPTPSLALAPSPTPTPLFAPLRTLKPRTVPTMKSISTPPSSTTTSSSDPETKKSGEKTLISERASETKTLQEQLELNEFQKKLKNIIIGKADLGSNRCSVGYILNSSIFPKGLPIGPRGSLYLQGKNPNPLTPQKPTSTFQIELLEITTDPDETLRIIGSSTSHICITSPVLKVLQEIGPSKVNVRQGYLTDLCAGHVAIQSLNKTLIKNTLIRVIHTLTIESSDDILIEVDHCERRQEVGKAEEVVKVNWVNKPDNLSFVPAFNTQKLSTSTTASTISTAAPTTVATPDSLTAVTGPSVSAKPGASKPRPGPTGLPGP